VIVVVEGRGHEEGVVGGGSMMDGEVWVGESMAST